jgi:hypothetical protein
MTAAFSPPKWLFGLIFIACITTRGGASCVATLDDSEQWLKATVSDVGMMGGATGHRVVKLKMQHWVIKQQVASRSQGQHG